MQLSGKIKPINLIFGEGELCHLEGGHSFRHLRQAPLDSLVDGGEDG